jgi:hypothetical protein
MQIELSALLIEKKFSGASAGNIALQTLTPSEL